MTTTGDLVVRFGPFQYILEECFSKDNLELHEMMKAKLSYLL